MAARPNRETVAARASRAERPVAHSRPAGTTCAERAAVSAPGAKRLRAKEQSTGAGHPRAGSGPMEAQMSAHKFKVGQLVDYAPGRLSFPASGGPYKIIRLLPAEDGQLHYRIKSTSETFERVAKESELHRRS